MKRIGCRALAAFIASGCAKAPTQIVVAIDSDLEVPAELVSVRALVKSEAEVTASERGFSLSDPAEVVLPFSFGVTPGSDPEATLIIEAQAIDPGESAIVIRRARTRFIPHQTLLLPLFLARSCANAKCPPGETCSENGCIGEEIDPASLQMIEPGSELVPRDGGPADAAVKDADIDDADVDDADVDDADVEDGGEPGPCDPPAQDGDSCGPGAMRCCRGSCADTSSDMRACGQACIDCGANAECLSGTCNCTAPFADCDQEPGCEADLTSDPLHCDQCMMPCPAGTSCIDRACLACTSALECPVDMLPCTDVPVCQNGVCSQPLFPGYCLIGGACYDDGDPHPTDRCAICESDNPLAWSPFVGNSCNDGQFCTQVDQCDAQGQCVGRATACPEDTYDCTTITCNEATARCDTAIVPGRCLVGGLGGVCVDAGDTNPSSTCYICDPNRNQLDWSPNINTPCDDLRFCTSDDRCDASFNCTGSTNTCNVIGPCWTQTCDEINDLCHDNPNPGYCIVNGTCYAEGAVDPNNSCQSCQTAFTPWDFSAVPDNSVACGFDQMCCSGFCTDASAGACGACGVLCPNNPCMCDGTGNPFSCCCGFQICST